eukprot:2480087-Amphidinium_carterae.3
MVAAGNHAKAALDQLELKLSTTKSTVVATSTRLAKAIAQDMAGAPFQVADIHKSLGTDVSAQRRRRTRLQQHRLAAATRRRKRLQRLRKGSAKIGQVLRAGPAAVALWPRGAFQGIAPGQLHTLRQRQLRAETSLPQRTTTELYWVVHN